ncbi:MAG TPA: hypothetical protein VK585_18420 [Jiangellaceae bacterium]|nr:hypothetical protein [Jiangellaceae bacterium]
MAFDAFEPARLAMGDTVRYADRARLIEMQPWRDLCLSGYLLASPGVEFLALQPEAGPFTVDARAGHVLVEWFAVNTRTTVQGKDVKPAHPLTRVAAERWPSAVNCQAQAR